LGCKFCFFVKCVGSKIFVLLGLTGRLAKC
jgi:hypothetical protein